jgi:restriction system protein
VVLEEVVIPSILEPDGSPLKEGSPERRELQLEIAEISEELIAMLAAEPELLYELSPRRFEELVAELYKRRGFETHLTPSSRDRGIDLYVVRHDELGMSLSVVQCKRYRAGTKVGPALVRELQGAMVGAGASAGVLLTTSFFTRGARAVEREFQDLLEPAGRNGVHALLPSCSLRARRRPEERISRST